MVAKPSPEAVLLFLKHAALDQEWTPSDIASPLGIDSATAKQIAEELALLGYAEAVPRKRDTWRNTPTGNAVAHVKPPRLTRKKAEELLTDFADRAAAFNLEADHPLRVAKIVAFGGINSTHDRIQDLDLGVQFEAKLGRKMTDADVRGATKALRGRAPSLKMHSLQGWPPRMGRVIWEK